MESWSPQSYISSTLHYSAASAGETPALPGKQECACGRDRWRTPFIQENPALFRVSSRDPSRKGWSCASYLEIVFLAPSHRKANKTTSRQSVQSVPLHRHLPWLLWRSLALGFTRESPILLAGLVPIGRNKAADFGLRTSKTDECVKISTTFGFVPS